MNGSPQSSGKLVWQEFLLPDEIADWAKSRKQPRKLWRTGGVSQAGVYRFIFPEAGDQYSCYIGVADHLGRRLHEHICPGINREFIADSGWSVRGAIQNSLGKCYLQRLSIKGSIDICCAKLNQTSFDDLFARILLENWAILYSERRENLRPRNRDIRMGLSQGAKDLRRKAKAASKKAGYA